MRGKSKEEGRTRKTSKEGGWMRGGASRHYNRVAAVSFQLNEEEEGTRITGAEEEGGMMGGGGGGIRHT